MFISPAFAQAAGGAGGAGMIEMLLPIALIFVVFYFLLIRPQQKQRRQHQDMLAAVRRGDRIVTNGGIIGTVAKVVNENELSVEIAEGIKVRVQRSMIATVMSRTEPVGAAAPKDSAGNDDKPSGPQTPVSKLKGLFGANKNQ